MSAEKPMHVQPIELLGVTEGVADEQQFQRKLRKLNSVLAGEASAKFSLLLGDVACFDCRISQLPNVELVCDYFRWRSADAVAQRYPSGAQPRQDWSGVFQFLVLSHHRSAQNPTRFADGGKLDPLTALVVGVRVTPRTVSTPPEPGRDSRIVPGESRSLRR